MSCGAISIYNFSVTGDCNNTNSGEVFFEITGGSAPYTVSEISTTGVLPTSAATTSYYFSGLSANTYVVQIVDSCLTAATYNLNIKISSGTCVSIESTNTNCGDSNGTITATSQGFCGDIDYYLYDINDNLIDSSLDVCNSYTFTSLSADTYYVIGYDGGGCSGRSESCIVKSSTTLNFGLYIVNDANCIGSSGSGKIFVTGQTGTPPYTYLWSNGQTGSTATGLTQGVYSVTVTDSTGCAESQIGQVTKVDPLVITSFTTISPSCFSGDGQVEVVVNGGTAPYYFSGSNGAVVVTFSDTYTFTGLSSGVFTVQITDAGLCTTTNSVSLITENGFSITTLNTTNSNCNNNDGEIEIILNTGSPSGTFTYTLIDASGNTFASVIQGSSYTFTLVPSGNYTLTISNGTCTYTTAITINNTDLFTITATTTGTTCGFDNGSIQILASSGGTLPYTYEVSGFPPGPVTTFNNLPSGFYNVSVTDLNGCTQTDIVYVSGSTGVEFNLFNIQPVFGNDGEIDAIITEGEPPFTYNWSTNVNGQTGSTVTGLTAGTYTLQVIDSNGCVSTKTTTLLGTGLQSSYQIYNICSKDFEDTGVIGKRGIQQMFIEGFFDLTSGDTNCVINSAVFSVDITINGANSQTAFYSSSGATDYPSDNEWADAISDLLYTFSGVSEVIIDIEKNQIVIKNDCTQGGTNCKPTTSNLLKDANVIIKLFIDYDISCVSCGTYQKVFQDDFEFIFMDNNSFIFQGP